MHHLEEIKKKKPDLIIAVLSSSLTMRGDLSIFDKFTKTKQALKAGVDLILELPLAYSMQRADIFAKNAISMLHMAGVDEIVLGSEKKDISIYEEKFVEEKKEWDKSKSMKENYSFLQDLDSNDTLGYFYYKEIKDKGYPIKVSLIQRIESQYKDSMLNEGTIQSATAIRSHLDYLEDYVPSFVYEDKDSMLDEEKLFSILKYSILTMTPKELKDIFFVDEGIEYKLKDIRKFNTLDSFVHYLSGKKYTKTRMKRMLMYILFHIKKEQMNEIKEPTSLRILGYSNKGKEYLNFLKKEATLYTNIKEGIQLPYDIELKVSKIIDTIYGTNLLIQEQKGPITIEK